MVVFDHCDQARDAIVSATKLCITPDDPPGTANERVKGAPAMQPVASTSNNPESPRATRGTAFLVAGLLMLGLGLAPRAEGNVGTDFKQGANNETNGAVTGLGNIHWISSIVQSSNSKYFEGMAVPQRIILFGLPSSTGNVYHLNIRHQSTKSGIHAYDFVTSYDQAVATAAAKGITTTLNPCGEDIGPPGSLGATCTALRAGPAANIKTVPAPGDPFVSKDGSTQQRITAFEGAFGPRSIKIYGNQSIGSAVLAITGHDPAANGSDTSDSFVIYDFMWVSTSDTVLIEMAGHLAVSG